MQQTDDTVNNTDSPESAVLVVDDDESISEFLTIAINELVGKRALVAHDGETALAMIHQVRPAAVLLDIMLPNMDGLAVFDELESDTSTATIPIIFMSVVNEYRPALRKRGAKRFLEKPFDIDDLVSALEDSFESSHQAA